MTSLSSNAPRIVLSAVVGLGFALFSFYIAAVAGLGYQDTAIEGARQDSLVTFGAAILVGLVGMVLALLIARGTARSAWVLLGALPALVLLLLNVFG